MIEFELYQPEKVNTRVSFPTSWNELFVEELNIIAQSFLETYKAAEAKALVFLSLLKIRVGKDVPGIETKLDAEDCALNGLPLIEFIYRSNDLTMQPYPKITLSDGIEYYGPADNFDKLTCGEFEDAEIFYNQFKADPDGILLSKLAAVLFRPKDIKYITYNKDQNEYVHYDIEAPSLLFRKLKAFELYTIFLWYEGCRSQLPKRFPNCFKAGPEESSQPDFIGFTKCIHAGAGPKNGTRTDIRRGNLNEFLFDCEEEIIKNEKALAEIKKNS